MGFAKTHFSPRARIACVSARDSARAELCETFAGAGYECLGESGDGRADLSLIDLRGHEISAKRAQKLTATLRRGSPESSMLFVAGPELSAVGRAHLRRAGEVVIVADTLIPAVDRCRDLLRLRNLAEETGERLKSLAAASRLTDFPPIETSNAAPSVLIAGTPGAQALMAIESAREVAGDCIGVLTAGQAMRAMETRGFDCAVFMPHGAGDPLLSLARAMRRHPKHRDLPVLFTADGEDGIAALSGRGAREILLVEHMKEDLEARILAWTRRARLAAAMRRFLTASAGEGVRDKASGVFAGHFLQQHGARICARADQTHRPLSLLGVRLQPEGGADMDRISETRALRHAAALVRRVTRAEDFLARLSRDVFIVAMPSTLDNDAERAGRRIEGVIANTMFRGRTDEELFPIRAQIAVYGRPRGACIEESVAGLLQAMSAQNPRVANI
ncbi:MAG: hypothetical protein ACE5FO_04635 [Parvularculaceae bacterium]